MESPIPVVCPACGRSGTVPAAYAGRPIRCKQCGGRVVVPAPASDAPAAVEAPARPRPPKEDAPARHVPDRPRRESAADDPGGVFLVGGTAPIPTHPLGMVVTPDRLLFASGPMYLLASIIIYGGAIFFCFPVGVACLIGELLVRKGQRQRWATFGAHDLDALLSGGGVREVPLTDNVTVDYDADKASFVIRNGWKTYRLKVAPEDRDEASRAARQLRRRGRRS